MAALLTGRWSILKTGASQEFVAVQITAGLMGLAGSWIGLGIAVVGGWLLGDTATGETLAGWFACGGGALGIGWIEWLWMTGRLKVNVVASSTQSPDPDAKPVRPAAATEMQQRADPVTLPELWQAEPLAEGRVRVYELDWKPNRARAWWAFIIAPWIVMFLLLFLWQPGWSEAWMLIPLVGAFGSIPALFLLILYLATSQRAEFIVGRNFLEEHRWDCFGVSRRRRTAGDPDEPLRSGSSPSGPGIRLVIHQKTRTSHRGRGELVHWYELALEGPQEVLFKRPLLRAETSVIGQEQEFRTVARYISQQTGWPLFDGRRVSQAWPSRHQEPRGGDHAPL